MNRFARLKGFNTTSKAAYSQTRQVSTLAMQARHSLIELLQKMVRGDAHFVHCLRRNPKTTDINVDRNYLAQQIRSFGLVETIRIRQNGYTHRFPFEDFIRRYPVHLCPTKKI